MQMNLGGEMRLKSTREHEARIKDLIIYISRVHSEQQNIRKVFVRKYCQSGDEGNSIFTKMAEIIKQALGEMEPYFPNGYHPFTEPSNHGPESLFVFWYYEELTTADEYHQARCSQMYKKVD